MGGIPGADAKCQAEAVRAELTGTFKAWLSGVNEDVRQWKTPLSENAPIHLTQAAPDENGIMGTEVVENIIALTTDAESENFLNREINFFATGGKNHGNEMVWTGTEVNGAPSNDRKYCQAANDQAWTSEDAVLLGLIGYHQTRSSDWIHAGEVDCSNAYRLYCLQVSHVNP